MRAFRLLCRLPVAILVTLFAPLGFAYRVGMGDTLSRALNDTAAALREVWLGKMMDS